MVIEKKRIFLSDGGHVDRMINLLKDSQCNLEVQAFSRPEILTGDLKKSLAEYKDAIKPLNLKRIFLHGPFFDITIASPDPEATALGRTRYLQGLDCALYLGADTIIFHSQYNPLLRLPAYINDWLTLSEKFYREILETEKYSGIRILVENMFEDSPDLLYELLKRLDSPRMGICMDVGHVNVYGKGENAHWIGKLSPFIRHLHLSDNDGLVDQHRPLGAGNVNFEEIFQILHDADVMPDCCLELGNEMDLSESLDFLDNLSSLDIANHKKIQA